MVVNILTGQSGTVSNREELGSPSLRSKEEFDPESYRDDLADLDLTEEQEDELLRILWDIMRRFVELGFDVNLCGQISDLFKECVDGSADLVELDDQTTQEKSITQQEAKE